MNLVSKITNGLAFYDLLDCPLTLVEMNRYLSSDEEEAENNPKVSLRQILVNLPSRAVFKNGFCFLNDDRGQVRQRIKREKSAAQKWRKLRRVGFFLQLIPFVRGVGVTGSMTLYNTRSESDFDLLIIARKGRIWATRAMISAFLSLINQKRYGSITKNRVCLNCFLTDQSLGIGEEIKPHNVYSAQEYARIVPLFELESGLWGRFLSANGWIGNYLLFYPWFSDSSHKVKVSKYLGWLRVSGEFLIGSFVGDRLESLLKNMQVKRIKKNLTNNSDDQIFFSDEYLLFHPHSKSLRHLEKFNEIISGGSKPRGI